MNVGNVSVTFIYASNNWQIYSQMGAPAGVVVTEDGTQTLTNKTIGSSQLTGALPAISGAALTNIPSHWTSLAEVTLGGSSVSGIDITLPTGYDVHKLEIRFPVCTGSTSRKLNMSLLDSNSNSLSYSFFTQTFESSGSTARYSGRFSTTFTMSEPYGANSTDYCFYTLQFFNVDSTTNYTMWQGQGNTFDNTIVDGTNTLTSGIEYGSSPTADTLVVHFELESSQNFAADDGSYYRLYGHNYS